MTVKADALITAAAQPPSQLENVDLNVQMHAWAIREANARLVVFPELSLTGYDLDLVAIDPADPRLHPIVDACRLTGSIALVGAPVESRGAPSIAMLRVDAAGVEVVYRKVWLGGEEPAHYAPGRDLAVIDVDGWRVGLAICKDTGMSQHTASIARRGVDLYVAGVAHAPDELDEQDARGFVIARTCGAPVVLSGFAGATGGGYNATAGHSTIWNKHGTIVARAGARPGAIARARLRASPSPPPVGSRAY